MLTTVKIAPGVFETYWNGEKTKYMIINGVLQTRYVTNVYGFCWIDNGIDRKNWVGTLRATKDKLTQKIEKDILRGEPWQGQIAA